MKNFFQMLLTAFMVISVVFTPAFAYAQTSQILDAGGDDSLSETIEDTGLGSANLESSVITGINIFLGLLALIAVILILYGGYTWMTAAGNSDKVESAKDIIKAAAIGLAIIMASWSITLYIIGVTQDVASAESSAEGGGESQP